MKLLVWLWNPWSKYENTRHNVWFKVLEKVCKEYWFSNFAFNKNYNAEISEWNIEFIQCLAIKPMTYMNLSWWPVAQLKKFYKLEDDDIIVIYDDIDMDIAKIRIRKWWSAWWHNGIKDIILKTWTQFFRRLKIWIWRPVHKDYVTDFVLGKFKKEEIEQIVVKEHEIYEYLVKWINRRL